MNWITKILKVGEKIKTAINVGKEKVKVWNHRGKFLIGRLKEI